jgi:hypothetical protein
MPADPLEWITAPLALLALTISVLSLWYSSLKGPDIVLCEKPCFVLGEIPREAFDHFVPHTLFSEARLLLVNNGTVSGVLKLNISFEPTIELKPFFDKATFSFTVGSNQHDRTMPPISISEKESCMIAIRLSVEFVNWKKYFAHDPVTKDEIHSILRKADWENRQRFDDFSAVLKPGMHIGKVNIRSNQTARTGLSGKIKMVQRSLADDLSIGVVTEDLTRNFRLSGTKWDTNDPNAILEELHAIHDHFDRQLREPVEQNVKMPMGLPEMGSLQTDLFQAIKNRCIGYDSIAAIVDFVMHSSGLDSRLTEYDTKTSEWNRRFRLYKENPSKNLEEALLNEKASLEKESLAIEGEILQMMQILKDCYLPSA